jgi:hypothetical protein
MKLPSVESKQKLNVPPSAVNVQHELAEGSAQSLFIVQRRTVSVVLHIPVTFVGHAAPVVHAVVVDEAAQFGNVPDPRSVVPQQIGVLALVQSAGLPQANGLESGDDAESTTAASCIVPPESTVPPSGLDVGESFAASAAVDASSPEVSSPVMPELLLLLHAAAAREPTSTEATRSRLRMSRRSTPGSARIEGRSMRIPRCKIEPPGRRGAGANRQARAPWSTPVLHDFSRVEFRRKDSNLRKRNQNPLSCH